MTSRHGAPVWQADHYDALSRALQEADVAEQLVLDLVLDLASTHRGTAGLEKALVAIRRALRPGRDHADDDVTTSLRQAAQASAADGDGITSITSATAIPLAAFATTSGALQRYRIWRDMEITEEFVQANAANLRATEVQLGRAMSDLIVATLRADADQLEACDLRSVQLPLALQRVIGRPTANSGSDIWQKWNHLVRCALVGVALSHDDRAIEIRMPSHLFEDLMLVRGRGSAGVLDLPDHVLARNFEDGEFRFRVDDNGTVAVEAPAPRDAVAKPTAASPFWRRARRVTKPLPSTTTTSNDERPQETSGSHDQVGHSRRARPHTRPRADRPKGPQL